MITAEILGAEGSAVTRVKLDGTCVVGTDRSCGLVLSDPSVEPRHVELRADPGGTVFIRRLSDAAETRVGSLVLGDEAEVMLPATMTVGDVSLRLSVATADTPAEAVSPSAGRWQAAVAWGLCLAIAVTIAGEELLTTYKAHPWREATTTGIGFLVIVPLWAGAWALGNRLFGYRRRFHRHLAVASAWGLVSLVVGMLTTGLRDIVYTDAMQVFEVAVGLLLIAGLLYLHISVASRWRPRTNALVAAGLVALLGGMALLPLDTDADKPIKDALGGPTPLPAALYMTRSTEAVSAGSDRLFEELDGMKARRSVKQEQSGS